MPYIYHHYEFRCVRCHKTENRTLTEEDYGVININDVTQDFSFDAQLDFSNVRREGAISDFISSGRANKINGELCDDCFVSLLEWFKNG